MFTILDSMPSQIAVLDAHGVILHVNSAWAGFARQSNVPDLFDAVGTSYLEACRRADDNWTG